MRPLSPRTPLSVYRLQFNADFPLEQGAAAARYLHRLGVTDIYASPLFHARSTSTHGYDGVAPSRIDPKLGGEEAFHRFVSALRAEDGMGLLLDIVPNHMAASYENEWWRDVMKHGRDSDYAHFFDIDWRFRDENGIEYVRIPVLGVPYRELLKKRELRLTVHDNSAEPSIRYYEHEFPLSDESLDEARTLLRHGPERVSPEELDALLARQHYRLVYWLDAEAPINYRRFLDVNELIALRVEEEDVFDAYHDGLRKMFREGCISSLRIDHIDGLRAPKSYLDTLQERFGPDLPVYVEKFVGPNEELPLDWATAGTTGYDALSVITRALIHADGLGALDAVHRRFTGDDTDRIEMVHEKKRRVLPVFFPAEYDALKARLVELAENDPDTIDLNVDELTAGLLEITASLDVYRTYLERDSDLSVQDREALNRAITAAGSRLGRGKRNGIRTIPFFRKLFLSPELTETQRGFITRWQQFCTAVMSIARDNSATFDFNRLISLSELGIDSDTRPFSVADFHGFWKERLLGWPDSLNATSTHDTKRSEDVRARLHVLSEIPIEWEKRLRQWSRWNGRFKTRSGRIHAPDPETETLIYQTLLGAWPLQERELPAFRKRLAAHLVKGAREAGRHSSWAYPSAEYEQAIVRFAEALITPGTENPFYADFLEFQRTLATAGMIKSLTQVTLKCTAPGAPDIYWGNEIWDFSLSDPDNRRPVDFDRFEDALLSIMDSEEHAGGSPRFARCLVSNWQDGRIKLFVVHKLLQLRRSRPGLFMRGDYLPLDFKTGTSESMIAFARRRERDWVIVAVPRFLFAGGAMQATNPLENSALLLPGDAPATFRNVFTGESPGRDAGGCLDLAGTAANFPMVVLTGSV